MNWGTIIQRGVCVHVCVFMCVTRQRESTHMCNCAHDRKVTAGRKMGEGRESLCVQPPVFRFGSGRFDSSTPISLLWHSSPLNRIDYWFCSLRLLWDFPSDFLWVEEKHYVDCHTMLHHLYKWASVTWEILSLRRYVLLRRLRVVMVLMQKLSPNLSCGILIWMKAGLLQNTRAALVSILRHGKTRWACLIIDRGGTEKNSPVSPQTWVLSDDITSPGAQH